MQRPTHCDSSNCHHHGKWDPVSCQFNGIDFDQQKMSTCSDQPGNGVNLTDEHDGGSPCEHISQHTSPNSGDDTHQCCDQIRRTCIECSRRANHDECSEPDGITCDEPRRSSKFDHWARTKRGDRDGRRCQGDEKRPLVDDPKYLSINQKITDRPTTNRGNGRQHHTSEPIHTCLGCCLDSRQRKCDSSDNRHHENRVRRAHIECDPNDGK